MRLWMMAIFLEPSLCVMCRYWAHLTDERAIEYVVFASAFVGSVHDRFRGFFSSPQMQILLSKLFQFSGYQCTTSIRPFATLSVAYIMVLSP